ncbi:MAG: tetratricopeptide repeat protein [Elusimicrobia bacterium]|nr:tetratricopeptide repeat protein [Candidatus Obscuribacterium magneticum]
MTTRIVLFFIVFSMLPAVYAGRYSPTRKSTDYSVEFRSRDPKGFYRSLSYILENQPPDHVATINAKATVAELLFETENFREAAQIYLQLTEMPLNDVYKLASFQYRLAECYFHMGLYGEAYDQFSIVRKGKHSALEAEATLGMAMTALAQGNRSSAQAHLDILLLENDYYKSYPRALYPLGIMLFQNEQYQRSLAFFEKDLEDPKSLYFAAIAYRRLGLIPKALSYFQKLTQKFPGTVWAQRGSFEVAETYYQQQDFQLAYQSFARWLSEYPNGILQVESQFRLAAADFRRKNYKAALVRLEPLLKLDVRPSLADRIQYLTGETWVELDMIEALANRIKRKGNVKERTPDDNYRLMWCLTALGRHEEALVLSEEGLNKFYDQELTPKILLIEGYCYDAVGKPAEALAAYQTVVDRFPKSAYGARALHLMSLSYVRAQRWQELVTHVYHYWANMPEDIKRENPEVEFWITEGQLSLGNFELAQKRYKDFLSAAPDHPLTPYAYLGLAVAMAQNNQLEAGFQTLQQFAAIAKSKEKSDWLALATLQSANIYYNQKSFDKAVGYYRVFQKDYPKDERVPQALFQEGQSLYRLEYYSDAVEVWTRLVNTHPTSPLAEKAQFQAARTLFDLGQTTAAVKAYQNYIVRNPSNPKVKEARLQLAHCYYNAGNYKEAIPHYQEFLLMYPDAEEAVSIQDFLQMSYVHVGKSDEELEALTKGQAKSQVLADLYWEKGAKAFNNKEYEASLTYFEKILIDFPASALAAQAAFYRAEALYYQEKNVEAASAYKNFLAQFPNDDQASTALFRLGVSLFNQNRFEEAAVTFESFLQRYPDDPLAKNAADNIPIAYAKLGRTAESEQAYQSLLGRTQDPKERAKLLLQVAQIKERNGEAAEAIKYYEQISPTVEEYPEALYAVGSIYYQAGQSEMEMKAYQKLLNFNPKSDSYRIAAISRLAELYISQGKAKEAFEIYSDVAKNAADQTALANAKTRLEELQKVLTQ